MAVRKLLVWCGDDGPEAETHLDQFIAKLEELLTLVDADIHVEEP